MPRDSRHCVSITGGTSTEVIILRVSDEQLLFFEAFVFCGLGQMRLPKMESETKN